MRLEPRVSNEPLIGGGEPLVGLPHDPYIPRLDTHHPRARAAHVEADRGPALDIQMDAELVLALVVSQQRTHLAHLVPVLARDGGRHDGHSR